MDLPHVTLVLDQRVGPFQLEGGGALAPRATVSFPAWLLEIDAAQGILDELHRWHQDDPPPRDWPPREQAEHGRFVARETARVGAYIVFACSIERLVERSFRQAVDMLRHMDRSCAESILKDVPATKSQLSQIRKLRNKVFAHPAGVAHQEQDSASLRATSVWMFCGNGAGFVNDEFVLGLGRVVFDGESTKDLEKLQAPSMRSVYAATEQSMAAWWTLLSRTMTSALEMEDGAFKAAFPGLYAVHRA